MRPSERVVARLAEVPEWAWVALALGLRLAFALKLGGRLYQIDEGAFDSAAAGLAQTACLGTPGHPLVIPPVPISFFAFFYLWGHHPLLPRLGQAFVGALTAWMIGRMTRDVTQSASAGRLALAVSSVYPFFIYYNGMLMSETLYIACMTAGLWWISIGLVRGGESVFKAMAGGAALALGALCRPEAAPIVAVLWVAGAGLCAARRWSWKAWALAVLCWALPILGWCARNKALVGRFALDFHGGITMLHGTLLFDLNEQDTGVAMEAVRKMPFYQRAESLPETERDRIYLRAALDFMREHPGRTVRQWGRKLLNFWRFYPRPEKVYYETPTNLPTAGFSRDALVAVSLLFEPWLIVLGFLGLWELRGRWEALAPWSLFMLGSVAVHVMSVSQMRYRLPVMPFLILASSGWIAARQSEKR